MGEELRDQASEAIPPGAVAPGGNAPAPGCDVCGGPIPAPAPGRGSAGRARARRCSRACRLAHERRRRAPRTVDLRARMERLALDLLILARGPRAD